MGKSIRSGWLTVIVLPSIFSTEQLALAIAAPLAGVAHQGVPALGGRGERWMQSPRARPVVS